jgi:UDP-glucose 4-epimerase
VRILVTGAAGFIGSHAVRHLHGLGHEITATDLAEPAAAWRICGTLRDDGVRYLAGPLVDVIGEAVIGVDQVWHFAANADIPLGARDTAVDLRESVLLTQKVLEAMRARGIRAIVFPSTSGVYGNHAGPVARETDGPLLPRSLYAVGKLACEGMMSAYSSLFGLNAFIFRLGNVVGGAMSRGIIRDFIIKLREDPHILPVLGDGRQRKSYVFVEDVIGGMRHIAGRASADGGWCDVYNLAAVGSVAVTEVGQRVATAMGLPAPEIRPAGGGLSWPGDQPVIELAIDKALSTGWRPAMSAADAVTAAAHLLLAHDDLARSGQPR